MNGTPACAPSFHCGKLYEEQAAEPQFEHTPSQASLTLASVLSLAPRTTFVKWWLRDWHFFFFFFFFLNRKFVFRIYSVLVASRLSHWKSRITKITLSYKGIKLDVTTSRGGGEEGVSRLKIKSLPCKCSQSFRLSPDIWAWRPAQKLSSRRWKKKRRRSEFSLSSIIRTGS